MPGLYRQKTKGHYRTSQKVRPGSGRPYNSDNPQLKQGSCCWNWLNRWLLQRTRKN